ncbi:hypothetical protein CDAR_550171 [Caerostris darwini]|uniref:Uncharacterized protein n=1 Tax=Caerostris darwini TaxID=1538125 RepID=A0AAV4PLA3_9ARAC|nr:hypothetical protein CDAR_550171 [Caerostris darwini]
MYLCDVISRFMKNGAQHILSGFESKSSLFNKTKLLKTAYKHAHIYTDILFFGTSRRVGKGLWIHREPSRQHLKNDGRHILTDFERRAAYATKQNCGTLPSIKLQPFPLVKESGPGTCRQLTTMFYFCSNGTCSHLVIFCPLEQAEESAVSIGH